jgi:hypothetical protein
MFEDSQKSNSPTDKTPLPEPIKNEQATAPIMGVLLLSTIVYSLIAWMFYTGETISRHDGFSRID